MMNSKVRDLQLEEFGDTELRVGRDKASETAVANAANPVQRPKSSGIKCVDASVNSPETHSLHLIFDSDP